MSKPKIIKFFILLLLSFIIATIAKTQLKLDYKNAKLDANIDFFDSDQLALADRKLYNFPLYGNVAGYFNPKNIGERINRKLNKSEICNRSFHAKKRNPKIVIDNFSINISIIFTNEKNAEKCSIEIAEYLKSQEDLFILETENIFANVTEGKRYIDLDVIPLDDIESSFFNGKSSGKENLQEMMQLLNLRQLFLQRVRIKNFKDDLKTLKDGTIFSYRSKIEKGDKNNIAFKIEYLTILILILLSLIFFRKEIEHYFNKIKNKL